MLTKNKAKDYLFVIYEELGEALGIITDSIAQLQEIITWKDLDMDTDQYISSFHIFRDLTQVEYKLKEIIAQWEGLDFESYVCDDKQD